MRRKRGTPLSIRLDHDLREPLEAYAEAEDRSMSSVINRVLREFFERRGLRGKKKSRGKD